jgi:hypothetical protein
MIKVLDTIITLPAMMSLEWSHNLTCMAIRERLHASFEVKFKLELSIIREEILIEHDLRFDSSLENTWVESRGSQHENITHYEKNHSYD